MTKPITPFQSRCLEALARLPMGHGSADYIAAILRMPKARLAVTSALRALLRRDSRGDPDVSEWIVRLPPRDRWGAAIWCMNDRAWEAVGYHFQAGHGWKKDSPNRISDSLPHR